MIIFKIIHKRVVHSSEVMLHFTIRVTEIIHVKNMCPPLHIALCLPLNERQDYFSTF